MENKVFLNCLNEYKKDIIEKLFESEEIYLFKALTNFTFKNDVFIEFAEIDFNFDNNIISIFFETEEEPAINFCTIFADKFEISVQNCYYSKEKNVTGKFIVYNHRVILNNIYSYWMGLYLVFNDIFWETVGSQFNFYITFESFTCSLQLNYMEPMDLCVLREFFERQNLNLNNLKIN